MKISVYQVDHYHKVLHLLRLNTPQYFAPAEEAHFIHYLGQELEQYFVVELEHQIVACGGINFFRKEKKTRISWDMIHPEHQRKGIGKALMQHRIAIISAIDWVDEIEVRTSQLAFRFYKKMGFELQKIETNFWAEGLDLYLMTIKLPD